jgi:phage shock protein PspC (stress-responsive transcriptional regulator)
MKPLRLSKADKKICGVCAAFANSFDIDVALVRVLWVCLTFISLDFYIAWRCRSAGIFAMLAFYSE